MLDALIQATSPNPPRTTVDHFPCAMISHVHALSRADPPHTSGHTTCAAKWFPADYNFAGCL